MSVGVDLVCVSRFARLLGEHPGAARELFTPAELACCAGKRRRSEHLAARFAAKEAVLKVLGTGLGPRMRWTDVEVTSDPDGRPLVGLGGAVAARADGCGFRSVCVSLTHTADLAIAQAAAVRGNHKNRAMDLDALSPD